MLLAIYALLSIAMALLATRVWQLLTVSAVLAIGATALSLDLIRMIWLTDAPGVDLTADLPLRLVLWFSVLVWLGTFLPALVIHWLKRLMSAPSAAK